MSIHSISDDQIFAFVDYETTGLARNGSKPIEIGIIFTDAKLKVLSKYEKLINWWGKYRYDFLYQWLDSEKGAWNVHKIPKYEVVSDGVNPETIQYDIKNIIQKINGSKNKPILISDNPHFEVFFTEVLFKTSFGNTPFHYNAWSVMPLFPMTGFEMEKPHRAMDDCIQLYNGMVNAYKVLGIF